MKNKGISFRLNSTITTVAIVIIATIVYINYHFSNQLLKDKIEEGAINQSNLVISKISRITVTTAEIARNVSYQALYYYKNNDLDFFLKQVASSNKILEDINVELLDPQKMNLLQFSSDQTAQLACKPDHLKSERYIQNLKSGKIAAGKGGWSYPFYFNQDTANLFVSYSVPVYSADSVIAGMVSCDISLRKMKQMLADIKIGVDGYAFIIDPSGDYITHPKDEWILRKNLFGKSSPIYSEKIKEIEGKIKNSGRGAGHGISEYLHGQHCWFYYAPLPNSHWTVIIVIPEKELFRQIEVNFRMIILVSGFGILILFLINMLIFRRILDPLARIANAIQGFSSAGRNARKSKNEIKMLTESLEDWQAKYGILIKEQSKTAREKLKYENDLKSAHDIQQNIIPSGYPAFLDHPEIDLFAVLKPAESIGGDLYDYYFIDNDHLLVAIGDVSGKGIPASLFMAIASTLIKSHSNILSSRQIIETVNNELGDRNPNQYFLTLFIGVLNVRNGIMDYCNAAHNYPYLLHPDGTMQTLSKSHGIPLGIYKNKTYKSTTIQLEPGDLILLYTDGVINSRNSAGIHYGIEKLKSIVQGMTGLSSKEVVTRLLDDIVIYEAESPQSDDISLMALKLKV
ncbi:MAG TPA: SpoIIE family protein phosphatase [Prolixibacteraceae bacterium]|jgi:sigma-B regulation protein RsbU (phosphoserine phosphatase)